MAAWEILGSSFARPRPTPKPARAARSTALRPGGSDSMPDTFTNAPAAHHRTAAPSSAAQRAHSAGWVRDAGLSVRAGAERHQRDSWERSSRAARTAWSGVIIVVTI